MRAALDAITAYTEQHQVPPLASLVTTPARRTTVTAIGAVTKLSPVHAYPWRDLAVPFTDDQGVLSAAQRYIAQEPLRPSRSEALEQIWSFYRDRRADFPKSILNHRESLIARVMAGITVDRAFDDVVGLC